MCRNAGYYQRRGCHQRHGGLIGLAVRGIRNLVGSGSSAQYNNTTYAQDRAYYTEQPKGQPTNNAFLSEPPMNSVVNYYQDKQMRKANRHCRKANRKADRHMAKAERHSAKAWAKYGDNRDGYINVAPLPLHPAPEQFRPAADVDTIAPRSHSVEELSNELPPAYGSDVDLPTPKSATVSPMSEK